MANDSHSSTVYVKWSSFRGGARHQNSWRDIKRGAVESGHGWMWVWASHGWEIVHNERGCGSRRETAAQKRCLRSQQKGSESVSTKYPSTRVKEKQEAQQEEPSEGESRKRWRKGNRERLAQLYCVRKITLRAEGDKTWGSVSSNHINSWTQRCVTTLRVDSVFGHVSASALKECFGVSLRANYVTFPTVRVFFLRWGKEGGSAEIRHRVGVCAFFTACASMWEGADIVLIRFLRWRLHLARIGNGTEDKSRRRGNEKGKQMEERTDGIKEKGKWRLREPEEVKRVKRRVIHSVQTKNEKKKCALPLLRFVCVLCFDFVSFFDRRYRIRKRLVHDAHQIQTSILQIKHHRAQENKVKDEKRRCVLFL